jgi:hypothetical protein
MAPAALGFRAHSGWTALVAIAIDDGSPMVLLRQRIHLVETFTYDFRQPYHTAKNMPSDDACAFIAQVKTEAARLARQAILSVQSRLQSQGYELNSCGLLLASGRPLPDLAHILASHALIHTADGELFRQALVDSSEQCGLTIFAHRENTILETASQALHQPPDDLARRLNQLGNGLGPPWSQDQKLSALVAWLSLQS